MSAVATTAFGALLRDYRMAASLTQEELAERAGLSQSRSSTEPSSASG